MGNAYIVVKAFLDDFNVDYIVAPLNNKKTLELGARYTPEGACLPLKITVGNLIQAHEMGADTQLMLGTWGPCRFGYYCEMQKEILEDIGLNMNAVFLEACSDGILELAKRLRNTLGSINVAKITSALYHATIISRQVDLLERLYRQVATREKAKGSAEKLYNAFRLKAFNIKGSKDIQELIGQTSKQLKKIDIDTSFMPLKIGIVGEIYGTIDSWTSFKLESRLCNMGVEVERYITISDWIIEHMIKNVLNIRNKIDFAKAAKPYISHAIGGHTRETVGHAVLHAQQGYDGVIQLYPLGCMPEIVAQSILPQVSKDYDIPILTLITDEMTGEAGYMTRVEAFVDLLLKRREQKNIKSPLVGVMHG
jgi:predicted nucleotide-binding protein (sugar kinase/HSP70/actin superfamily)